MEVTREEREDQERVEQGRKKNNKSSKISKLRKKEVNFNYEDFNGIITAAFLPDQWIPPSELDRMLYMDGKFSGHRDG